MTTKLRRVDVHMPAADAAADAHTVFGMNDVYLEDLESILFTQDQSFAEEQKAYNGLGA